MSDIDHYHTSRVVYTFDFNLLFPFLFPGSPSKHKTYDRIGKNTFSLLARHHTSVGFRPSLTVPSLLELLDVLAHRKERISLAANSNGGLKRLSESLKREFTASGDVPEDRVKGLRATLQTLRTEKPGHPFETFVEMLRREQITTLRRQVDPEMFRSKDFRDQYALVLERMQKARSSSDDRRIDDRDFHYRVDSWNLAVALASRRYPSVEIDHVCSPRLSQHLPQGLQTERSRHPYVALIRLYSLYAASSQGEIKKEAHEFVRYGAKDLEGARGILRSVNDPGSLSLVERDRVDQVYNRYIRTLHRDFSEGPLEDRWHEDQDWLRDSAAQYPSVLTEDGLRARFEVEEAALKRSAERLVELQPVVLDERLLGDYDLANNSRVAQVRRSLGL